MNTVVVDIGAMEARRNEIDEHLAALKKEAADLDIALRVARQFAKTLTMSTQAEIDGELRLGPARPDGIPTIFQMSYEVIRDAEQRGQGGLTASEVVEAIGDRYWPGVKGPQIQPSIYGFVKAGRLAKNGDKFQTIQGNKPPTEEEIPVE